MLTIFRNEPKLMLSSSNDGNIIAWGSGGSISDTIAVSYMCIFISAIIIV